KKSLDKSIQLIHIVSLHGMVVSSTDPKAIGMDVSWDTYFIKGKDGPAVAEGRGSNDEPMLAVSAPVRDIENRNTIGVIVNFIRLSELDDVLSGEFTRGLGDDISWSKGKRKTMETYLVNRARLMITGSIFVKDAVLKQTVDILPVVACIERAEEVAMFYKNYRAVEVAGASMCLSDMKWTLVVEVDSEEVLLPASRMKRDAIVTGFIVAGLIGLLFIFFMKGVVGGLRRIKRAADGMADGDMDISLPVNTRDEIGALSDAFNTMAVEIKKSTAALKESEAGLARAQAIAQLGSWDWDITDNTLKWSEEVYRIFGVTPEDFDTSYDAFLGLVHMDDRGLVKDAINQALHEGKHYSIDHRIVRRDGSERIVHEDAEVTYGHGGLQRMFGTVQDITDFKKAEEELKKLTMAIEQSGNIIFITDKMGHIEYVNSAFEHVTGYTRDEAIGQTPRLFAAGDTPMGQYRELWETIQAGKTWRGTFKNRNKVGRHYWCDTTISPILNERGEIRHYLAEQEDVTEKRLSEERIERLTAYDDLTGLVNRERFIELLNEWLAYSYLGGNSTALLLIDLDHFRMLNDTYGHATGDLALKGIAERIKAVVRDQTAAKEGGRDSVLGRISADEFAVFFPARDGDYGLDTAEGIRKCIEGFSLETIPVRFTVSMGLVVFPRDGNSTKALFTKVDTALQRAKSLGGNRCYLYRPEDHDIETIHKRLKGKERIQDAFAEDRFEPWFQPIMGLKDGNVHHYEALIRLRERDGSIHLPGTFISTAEGLGLVGMIDRIVTDKTMKIQAELRAKGHNLGFAMNISGKDMGDDDLLDYLKSKIKETGADPSGLVFEITETAAVHELDRAIKFVRALKEMGCKFSLDDFGVGFTSFVYLKELNVDFIKIDGSFIRKLDQSPNDQLFVKAMTYVAGGMGIKTIAEFVEREEVLRLLKDYGVDYAQGYLIGRPVKLADLYSGILDVH
ncbi:MAG: EAL domain-containing protein, partial [Deltaproteobacteria bacterium]|nr:EAL domain-containing protein [Deltaproteobacteria bacterium]